MDNILNSGNSPNLPLSSPRAVAPPLSPDAPSLALPQPVGPPPSANSLPQETRSAPPSPVVTPALAHNAALGQFTKMLLGHTDNYSVVDGKVVNTPTQNKPGDLFRHIMAGVLLGGAAGSGGTGGLAGGAGRGAAAVMQHSEQDRQTKMQQAQNDFERQRQVKEDSRKDAEELRKEQEFKTNQSLLGQQHAMNTANLYRLHLENEKMGASFVMEQVDRDKAAASAYQGITPLAADIPLSEATQLLKDNPNVSSSSTFMTGARPVTTTNSDGVKTTELEPTFTAYPKNAKVQLTPGLKASWKNYLDLHPDAAKMLGTMTELTPQQFSVFRSYALAADQDAIAKAERDSKLATTPLMEKKLKAEIEQLKALAAKDRAEGVSKGKADTAAGDLSSGLAALGDGKSAKELSPGQRAAVINHALSMSKEVNPQYNALLKAYSADSANTEVKSAFDSVAAQKALWEGVLTTVGGVPPPTAKVHPEGKVSISITDENGRKGTIVDPDKIEQTLNTKGIKFNRDEVAKAGKAYANYVLKPGESALYDEKGDFQGFSPTDSFLGINSAKTLRGLNPGWTSVSKPSEPIKETPYKPSLTHR